MRITFGKVTLIREKDKITLGETLERLRELEGIRIKGLDVKEGEKFPLAFFIPKLTSYGTSQPRFFPKGQVFFNFFDLIVFFSFQFGTISMLWNYGNAAFNPL